MRRLVLSLALAAPLAAAAQYPAPYGRPVPYGYPPPRPPPPPPVAWVQPPPPSPSPFYFNLGIGYGDGGAIVDGYWTPLAGWYATPGAYGGPGGLAWHAEAGARLAPQVLLGFDVTGLSTYSGTDWAGGGVTLIDYDLVATLFPFGRGLFLRGGAGLCTASGPAPAPGLAGETWLGTNLLLGAGWAFPVAPPLSVTLGIDWSRQFLGAPGVDGTSFWSARIGFGWY
jgi:hypothetical protein